MSPRQVLGLTQSPIQWVPGVKRPRDEADHSHPTSAEVKKTWIYTSTYVFSGLVVNELSTGTTSPFTVCLKHLRHYVILKAYDLEEEKSFVLKESSGVEILVRILC
jgi:hypothetical protein